MKNIIYLIYILSIITLLNSCESEYSKAIKSEMKSGVVYKELFLTLEVGDTKKDFYDKCWDLNKEGLVSQGPGNKYAKYSLDLPAKNDSTENVVVLFYGIFDKNEVMYGMDMKMSYSSWSPWNEDYHSDRLMNELQKYYMTKYGKNEFITIELDNRVAYAKIDGNRQVLIFPLNKKDVSVKITDTRKRYDIN